MSHTPYISPVIDRRRRKITLQKLVERINESGIVFDSIAVRGVSGLLVGPALADALDKELVVVRKPGDSNHCSYRAECSAPPVRYVFVDDLISSGDTFRKTTEEVRKFYPNAECVGVFLYNDGYQYSEGVLRDPLEEGSPRVPAFAFCGSGLDNI